MALATHPPTPPAGLWPDGPAPDAAAPLVLVVDDEAADRELHCLVLRGAGARTVAAADGVEGLVCARTLLPDLVVADLRMPLLDGWGLLARLRAAPATAHIPVLLVTVDAADVPGAVARAAGFSGVLAKPLDLGDLRRAARALLPRRPGDLA
jgi:CheY-like chemotaxis protein